jgi:hypothetical protein
MHNGICCRHFSRSDVSKSKAEPDGSFRKTAVHFRNFFIETIASSRLPES